MRLPPRRTDCIRLQAAIYMLLLRMLLRLPLRTKQLVANTNDKRETTSVYMQHCAHALVRSTATSAAQCFPTFSVLRRRHIFKKKKTNQRIIPSVKKFHSEKLTKKNFKIFKRYSKLKQISSLHHMIIESI